LETYERELVEERLLPLLPSQWHQDFEYLLFQPFEDRIRVDGETSFPAGGVPEDVTDDMDPVDGRLIKTCDLFAAYLEAETSIRYGISSKTLQQGRDELRRIIALRDDDGPSFQRMMEALDDMEI